MKNFTIFLGLVGILIFIYICFRESNKEKFSDSGLAINDLYCEKIVDAYYRPQIKDSQCRKEYMERICGKKRKNTIDFRTGNYFTHYGYLI